VAIKKLKEIHRATHPGAARPQVIRPRRLRYPSTVTLTVEFDREEDGRFLADIPTLPGVMAYGTNREEALEKVKALALHVVADMLEHGELTAA
jgi:predicted RNase H-like HicB family nuclease